MTITLGISAFYHDSAAAIVKNGEIIAAAQEERFSRQKGDPSFPISAISYCLEEMQVSSISEVDSIVYYDKPLLTFERLIDSTISVAPKGIKSWLQSMPYWIEEKLHIHQIIKEALDDYSGPILYTPHHLSHAAAAYFPSPFVDAAVLTIDGVGEWATATCGIGSHETLTLLKEMRFPDSVGLLYSAFTYFCGFKVNSGEYKLMGLAPYGEPVFLDLIKTHIAEVNDDGSIRLNMDYFGFLDSLEMTSDKFSRLFNGPRRLPESKITHREMDLAASIQALTNEVVLKMAHYLHRLTDCKNLCLAGGVALNCVTNGELLRKSPFEKIWVQPAAGDAGSALGAALLAQFGYHEIKRPFLNTFDHQKGSYLGPKFHKGEIQAYLKANHVTYREIEHDEAAEKIAEALADGKIVAVFKGRMEFGPRALGARSILGDPRRGDMQKKMNLKIKYRESFRPFAPVVLEEDASVYFDLDISSPYMMFVVPVHSSRCIPRPQESRQEEDLLQAVNQLRSDIPAVTHFDYSARVQTVNDATNPFLTKILRSFKEKTGCGVLVNTSFNVRGEPIVCTPQDAYKCLLRTEIDFLYLEGFWLDRTEQKNFETEEKWKSVFVLD